MRPFREEAAKGRMSHVIIRDDGDTEIRVEVEYYYEPAWAPDFTDPGSGASATFNIIKPAGLVLTDEELDEIEAAIIEHEGERQIIAYERAADYEMEARRDAN